MSILTEQEIFECLPDNGDSIAFARAVEAAVIEKIKAQRPVSVETLTSSGKKTWHYYHIPEGEES